MKNISSSKAEKIIDKSLFGVLLLLYCVLMGTLFYLQAIEYQGNYISDMKAYILETQGLESGYEFPYRLFFWISRIWMFVMSPEAAVALTTVLLDGASVVLIKYYFGKQLKACAGRQNTRWNILWDIAVTVATFSLFFQSMVYNPRGEGLWGYDYIYRCIGAYTPNPYWNATYMAVRPFSIVCFFQTADILGEYKEKFQWKQGIFFGIILFLATFTKPSFTFIIVPVIGIVLIKELISSRGTSWGTAFRLGCCMLPTGILLLYQYFGVFGGEGQSVSEELGIGFEIGKAWHLYSTNIPLSLMMALLFPFAVLVLNLKELKRNRYFRLAWQVLLVGFLTLLCLYEKGFRFSHMNFSWGYMHGLFLIYMISTLQILKNATEWRYWLYKIYIIPEIALWAYHLQHGIEFFLYMLQGNNAGLF